MEYVTPTKAIKILGVCTRTLKNWEEKGKIEVYRTPTGHRRYKVQTDKVSQKKKKQKKKSVDNVAYYKIPVDFEITGNFLGYIKFKRQLSLSQKMLNFDKESIKVIKGKGDSTGAIKVNGTLTIVGLADDFF